MNLGGVECDDGNLISGDGCDSNCMIEYGYKCTHQEHKRDYCFDIIPPEAKLLVINNSYLAVNFSEPVRLDRDSINEFYNSLSFEIQSTSASEIASCDYSWKPFVSFDDINIKSIKIMQISLNIKCSLKGYSEEFVLTFKNPSIIKDLTGNNLKNSIITAKTKKFIYLSNSEKAAISGSGSAFAGAGLTTMFLGVGMMLFQ